MVSLALGCLLMGLAAFQQVDVELFSSFLEGKYAEPTLLFFLSARMALQVKPRS